jgi:hypothetical protein
MTTIVAPSPDAYGVICVDVNTGCAVLHLNPVQLQYYMQCHAAIQEVETRYSNIFISQNNHINNLTQTNIQFAKKEKSWKEEKTQLIKELDELKLSHKLDMEAHEKKIQVEHEAKFTQITKTHTEVNQKIQLDHETKITQLVESHNNILKQLQSENETKINQISQSHKQTVKQNKSKHEAQLNQLIESHNKAINEIKSDYETKISQQAVNQVSEQVTKLQFTIQQKNELIEARQAKFQEMLDLIDASAKQTELYRIQVNEMKATHTHALTQLQLQQTNKLEQKTKVIANLTNQITKLQVDLNNLKSKSKITTDFNINNSNSLKKSKIKSKPNKDGSRKSVKLDANEMVQEYNTAFNPTVFHQETYKSISDPFKLESPIQPIFLSEQMKKGDTGHVVITDFWALKSIFFRWTQYYAELEQEMNSQKLDYLTEIEKLRNTMKNYLTEHQEQLRTNVDPNIIQISLDAVAFANQHAELDYAHKTILYERAQASKKYAVLWHILGVLLHALPDIFLIPPISIESAKDDLLASIQSIEFHLKTDIEANKLMNKASIPVRCQSATTVFEATNMLLSGAEVMQMLKKPKVEEHKTV